MNVARAVLMMFLWLLRFALKSTLHHGKNHLEKWHFLCLIHLLKTPGLKFANFWNAFCAHRAFFVYTCIAGTLTYDFNHKNRENFSRFVVKNRADMTIIIFANQMYTVQCSVMYIRGYFPFSTIILKDRFWPPPLCFLGIRPLNL